MNLTCSLHTLYWEPKTLDCMSPQRWSWRESVLFTPMGHQPRVKWVRLTAETLCGWEEKIFCLDLLKLSDPGAWIHFILSLSSLLFGSQRPRKGTQGESAVQPIAWHSAKNAPMQGKAQSSPVPRTWQSCCSTEYVAPEDSRVQPLPCSLCPAACWPGGFSCDSWEKFWRILETRSLDVHFTIATFNSKNKSVITISLSYCGANWICWKYRAKQVIWFITTDTSPHL